MIRKIRFTALYFLDGVMYYRSWEPPQTSGLSMDSAPG